MNKIEPGCLAILRGLVLHVGCNNKLVEVLEPVPSLGEWVDPNGDSHFNRPAGPAWAVKSCGTPFDFGPTGEPDTLYGLFHPSNIRPIGDNPGNEHFVVEARKTLPRPTPVPGPVTINERGEVEG